MSRHRARVVEFGHRKIHAIKLVRELSRAGLREAKEIVERGASFHFELGRAESTAIDEAARAGIRLDVDPPLAGAPAPVPARSTSSAHGPVTLRYLGGPNKIHAIKLVREIAGVGLKDAKDIVEQSRPIPRSFAPGAAEAIRARFEAIGSQVALDSERTPAAPSTASAPQPDWDEDDDDF